MSSFWLAAILLTGQPCLSSSEKCFINISHESLLKSTVMQFCAEDLGLLFPAGLHPSPVLTVEVERRRRGCCSIK